MKLTTLFSMVVVAACQFTYAQDSLTVEQAVQRVLAEHPAIKQAIANTGVSQARTEGVGSSRYPHVIAEAQYTRLGPVPELSIPNMGSFKFYPENNYDAHIAAQYTLYDFGKRSTSISLSQARGQLSWDAVELTKTGLALQTIRTFYAILFLEKSLKVQDEQIEALNQHLSITQKRVAAGAATDFDVLTTQVRVASAQNQKVDIENALRKQQSVLRQLMGLPEQASIHVQGTFSSQFITFSPDSLFKKANQQRIELVVAHHSERTAELQYHLSTLGYRPSLSLNASYGYKNGYIPDLDKMQDNWVAGVNAEMPIFDGGRISHQKDEAQAALLAEQMHLKDVENKIRSDVEQAIADVKAAQSKISISDIQLEQAHEAVEIAKARYETGSITNLDLLDTETAESAAKLGQIQAQYHYIISKVNLDRAVGEKFYQE